METTVPSQQPGPKAHKPGLNAQNPSSNTENPGANAQNWGPLGPSETIGKFAEVGCPANRNSGGSPFCNVTGTTSERNNIAFNRHGDSSSSSLLGETSAELRGLPTCTSVRWLSVRSHPSQRIFGPLRPHRWSRHPPSPVPTRTPTESKHSTHSSHVHRQSQDYLSLRRRARQRHPGRSTVTGNERVRARVTRAVASVPRTWIAGGSSEPLRPVGVKTR